jgi:hypothetical protein
MKHTVKMSDFRDCRAIKVLASCDSKQLEVVVSPSYSDVAHYVVVNKNTGDSMFIEGFSNAIEEYNKL